MKLRKLVLLPAVCAALSLSLGACNDDKTQNAETENACFSLCDDGKTINWVKDKNITTCVIPDGITRIEDWAFSRCSKLTSVTIPNSVTSIGYYAFTECESLTDITIPDSVTGIGKNAFEGIKNVQYAPAFSFDPDGVLINTKHKSLVMVPESLSGSYTIPSGITSIGAKAFFRHSTITDITIPDSITSIGDGAFSCVQQVKVSSENQNFAVDQQGLLIDRKQKRLLYASPAVTSVTIPDSVTSIGARAFDGCSSLASVTIPNSVTSIGNGAFYGCKKLTGITIPNSVTSIGNYAFEDCRSLTGITIPDSVTSIGDGAFAGCSSLTSITIPASVTSIGESAFFHCSALTSITIPSCFTDEDVKTWFYDYFGNSYTFHCKIIRK